MSVWQNEELRCAAVLREVFAWLGGRELARAGAACRAWRRAAAAPAHWRRLLRRELDVPDGLLRALTLPASAFSWRQEYVSACAGWQLAARHSASATLLHAQLAPCGTRLALAAADASLALWAADGTGAAWSQLWRTELRTRGWRAVARVQWAAGGARLLLTGPLVLVDDWELLVLCVQDNERRGIVASRVRCSPGAAGCWADAAGDTFLSFELSRLGPGLYCTTVWLNAATQETQSEYAGVTTPLIRIYNEDGANFTHALVTEAPALTDDDELPYLRPEERCMQHPMVPGAVRMLVAGGGCTLAAWPVAAPHPPPLLASAAGELTERLRRHRQRLAQPEEFAPDPDEASVRAVCTAPAHSCQLTAPLVGLVLHSGGRCLWAVCSDGTVTCASADALSVLWCVRAPVPSPAASPVAHYVQPAVSATLLASPAGEYSARVWCCSARSGARSLAPERQAVHGAPALCCMLPPTCPPTLLVLAGEELYVWRSRATSQGGEAPPSGYE